MAYEKLNLKDGVVLNQNHFAHIEEGIVNAENRPNISLNANVGSGNDTTISVLSTDNNEVICGASLKAVRYDSQPGLTEEQKAQARENIGAVTETTFSLGSYFGGKNLVLFLSGKSVVDTVELPLLTYNKLEVLNDAEKAQARKNIGAASVAEVLAALPVYAGEVEAV